MIWKALVVEIISILWNEGLYKYNIILQQIHKSWFPFWVEWKIETTVKDADRQIEEMFLESEIDPPVFSEDEKGETPLGGIMKLRAPWLDEEDDTD